jgi:cytidylate kinase
MLLPESVVVGLNGPAKVGKGFIADRLAAAAFSEQFLDCAEGEGFNGVVTVSAGNSYRAAALWVVRNELVLPDEFNDDHTEEVRELLLTNGIETVLQTDPEVKSLVATVAKIPGAQTVCSALYCDQVMAARQKDGGGNLVIADARDPIGHMKRNGLLGLAVPPESVIPIYIDTPASLAAKREVAAAKTPKDYYEELEAIVLRRFNDATRREIPVEIPDVLLSDFDLWSRQFEGQKIVADHLLLLNDEGLTLPLIDELSRRIARVALSVGHRLAALDVLPLTKA